MSRLQLPAICRTCDMTESNNRLHSLFNINDRLENYPESLANMLQELVKIDLPDDHAEKLPQYMCVGCTRKLLDAHDFVAQARDATQRLIKQLIKDEPVETIAPPMVHWVESQSVAENPLEDKTMLDANELVETIVAGSQEARPPIEHCSEPKTVAENIDKTQRAHLDEFEVEIESDVMGTVAAEAQSQSQSEQNTGEKTIQCIVCEKIFDTPALLKVHRRTHGEKPFKCDLCGMAFKSKFQFQRHKTRQSHQRTHMEKPIFKCDLCGKTFKSKYQLKCHKLRKSHQRTHIEKPIFKCDLCEREFSKDVLLKLHQREHAAKNELETSTMVFQIPCLDSSTAECQSTPNKKSTRCPLCKKNFESLLLLKVHRRTHRGEKRYSCYVCGKAFKQNYPLQQHVKTHFQIE